MIHVNVVLLDLDNTDIEAVSFEESKTKNKLKLEVYS